MTWPQDLPQGRSLRRNLLVIIEEESGEGTSKMGSDSDEGSEDEEGEEDEDESGSGDEAEGKSNEETPSSSEEQAVNSSSEEGSYEERSSEEDDEGGSPEKIIFEGGEGGQPEAPFDGAREESKEIRVNEDSKIMEERAKKNQNPDREPTIAPNDPIHRDSNVPLKAGEKEEEKKGGNGLLDSLKNPLDSNYKANTYSGKRSVV